MFLITNPWLALSVSIAIAFVVTIVVLFCIGTSIGFLFPDTECLDCVYRRKVDASPYSRKYRCAVDATNQVRRLRFTNFFGRRGTGCPRYKETRGD